MNHNIDYLTRFCIKCGRAYEKIFDLKVGCVEEDNVTGISHRIAKKKFEKLTKK